MSLLAVFTWLITIGFGLFMLGIWLVENDRDSHHASATRLPVPVLSAHALFAVGGIPIWLVYLVTDEARLAWAASIILVVVGCLGLIMAIRWIGSYRAHRAQRAAAAAAGTVGAVITGKAAWPSSSRVVIEAPAAAVPAERNFPLAAVLCHGLFAATTVVLVLLTALGVGGS